MTPSEAHALSLPLYAILQRLEGRSAAEASLDTQEALRTLHLEEDISSVIVIDERGTSIHVESRSEVGEGVLEELRARSHFLPCPDGECEYCSNDICRWCGGKK